LIRADRSLAEARIDRHGRRRARRGAYANGAARVLEARFFPESKSAQAFMTVGRVQCERDRTVIEPAVIRLKAVKPFDSSWLYQTLEFLVETVIGEVLNSDPFDSLLALPSEFWSFVEAPPRRHRGFDAA
jgi:hypothetical protein